MFGKQPKANKGFESESLHTDRLTLCNKEHMLAARLAFFLMLPSTFKTEVTGRFCDKHQLAEGCLRSCSGRLWVLWASRGAFQVDKGKAASGVC